MVSVVGANNADRAAVLRSIAQRLDENRALSKSERSTASRTLTAEARRLDSPAMPQHTRDELKAGAKHVRYENAMLYALSNLIQSKHFEGDVLGINMVTECGLLHVRVLDDFFRLPRRTMRDDIIARDFDDRWQPQAILSTKDRTDVNKKLAHLTTERVHERSWRMLDYFQTASALLGELLAHLTPEVALWFTDPELNL
jgi:hypothetical protein